MFKKILIANRGALADGEGVRSFALQAQVSVTPECVACEAGRDRAVEH